MKDTKERILAEGLNLLTSTGFANVTVGVLAQRTGMSKSGLFAHFGSKEDVQLELLEETLRVATATFIAAALRQPAGIQRLSAVVYGWFGWTRKAGLEGGCPIAAGLFEYDDAPVASAVRQRLVAMEEQWRMLLGAMANEAVDAGEFRADLDVEQFVWELCGMYLNHHVSQRFLHDPKADLRAQEAFESLVKRARLEGAKAPARKQRRSTKEPAREAR